jgi:Rap1a immunity proteins
MYGYSKRYLKMKLKLSAFLLMLFICMPAYSASALLSGKSFLSICEAKEDIWNVQCLRYIEGVNDVYKSLDDWDLLNKKIYCMPGDIQAKQLKRIVVRYLNEYPEELHTIASGHVLNAFILAFPCKG